MPSAEFRPNADQIQCEACRSAFESAGRQAVSFLLLDQLTIPAVSCDEHLERFGTVCGLSSEDETDLLEHRPAGGITCPGCRQAPFRVSQPLVPVQSGGVMLLACPQHHSEIVQRFQTGLETRQYLASGFDSHSSFSPTR